MPKHLALNAQLRACRLLAELLQAGFSLSDGLAYLSVAMPKLKPQWTGIEADLAAGDSLAEALAKASFHPLIVSQVALAEVHGQLADSLQQASDYLQLQAKNRARLQQLLVYPAILMGLLIGVQLTLWFAILPSLMIAPSQTWRWQLLVVALIGGLALIAGIVYAKAPYRLRFAISQWLPGIRGLVRLYYQYQFVAGASHYLAAGLTLGAYAKRLAEGSPGVLQQLGANISAALADGQELPIALQQPLVYPPMAELVSLGQTQAIVKAGMVMFAKGLFAQLQVRYERLLNLVQPVMFLAIGLQIVMVYSAILGPLYNSVRS